MSMGCNLMSNTYAACTTSAEVRYTSGPSTDVMIQIATRTPFTFTGSTAASLLRAVSVVHDSASLLTYTPPGATVIAVSTITTDLSSPSSTMYYGSNGQITAQSTSTPSSSSGARRRGAGLERRNLEKAVGAGVLGLVLLGAF